MPCVRDVCPLVGPAEGDGDLRPRAIDGVGDSIFCVDGEHPAGGEFWISSVLDGGEAPEDSGDYFVMILEGVIFVPRWSVTSGSIIVVIILVFGLELLSQAKAVLHLCACCSCGGGTGLRGFSCTARHSYIWREVRQWWR